MTARSGFIDQIRDFLRARPDPQFSKYREQNSLASGLSALVGLIATIGIGAAAAVGVRWAPAHELIVRAPAIVLCFLICPYLWYAYHQYVALLHPTLLGPHTRQLATVAVFVPSCLGTAAGSSNVSAIWLASALALGFGLAWWFAYMFKARVEDSFEQLKQAPWEMSPQVTVDRLKGLATEWMVANAVMFFALPVICFSYPYVTFVASTKLELDKMSIPSVLVSGLARVGWLLFLLVVLHRLGSGSRSEAFTNYPAYREEIRALNAAWARYASHHDGE